MALTIFHAESLFGEESGFEFYINGINNIVCGNSRLIEVIRNSDGANLENDNKANELSEIDALPEEEIYIFVKFRTYEVKEYEEEFKKDGKNLETIFRYHNVIIFPLSEDLFKDNIEGLLYRDDFKTKYRELKAQLENNEVENAEYYKQKLYDDFESLIEKNPKYKFLLNDPEPEKQENDHDEC